MTATTDTPQGNGVTGRHSVERIVRRRTRGWKMPENTISVTRPGKWGNPFRVTPWRTNAQAVAEFVRAIHQEQKRRMLGELPRNYDVRWMIDHIDELAGKNLACYCKAGAMCHAEVLLRLANTEVSERRAADSTCNREAPGASLH